MVYAVPKIDKELFTVGKLPAVQPNYKTVLQKSHYSTTTFETTCTIKQTYILTMCLMLMKQNTPMTDRDP